LHLPRSAADLAATVRRAPAAHGEHDVNWPDWYAEYIVNEQAGKPLPQQARDGVSIISDGSPTAGEPRALPEASR
jgi:hypothetical protein